MWGTASFVILIAIVVKCVENLSIFLVSQDLKVVSPVKLSLSLAREFVQKFQKYRIGQCIFLLNNLGKP